MCCACKILRCQKMNKNLGPKCSTLAKEMLLIFSEVHKHIVCLFFLWSPNKINSRLAALACWHQSLVVFFDYHTWQLSPLSPHTPLSEYMVTRETVYSAKEDFIMDTWRTNISAFYVFVCLFFWGWSSECVRE